ncbi:MAG: hypothetical protein WCG26_00780 [Chloroflexales bacterium]
MSSEPTTLTDQQTIKAACAVRLNTIFARTALVWIINEQYDPIGPIWNVNLICQADRGIWMQRRYRYDIPSDTLQFAGEQPASDDELLAARRGGRRLSS